MNIDEFRKHAYQTVDWICEYFENIEKYPVRSSVKPKDVYNQLSLTVPAKGESFDEILNDFKSTIIPGMTHWQHPRFFAYFPSNNSFPSILADMIINSMSAQCMSWATSPAATELEEKMMEWLREAIGLPKQFKGVIQDTASTATLCALLTAREKVSNYEVNKSGFNKNQRYRIYCSSEAHSSIEKAIKIAGFGSNNLVKIDVDSQFSMDSKRLNEAIEKDLSDGYTPLAIVAALGTTGSVAFDPLHEIAKISEQYGIWLHVDAAYAGTALICEEERWMLKGISAVDSFVFNPHKWMMISFDCSAYFIKDEESLIRTFEILPEYLKTNEAERVNNYRDWGIQLGRRFRALKLWFTFRSFGIDKMKEIIRNHILLAKNLETKISKLPYIEILAPNKLNVLCFRFKPITMSDELEMEKLNQSIMEEINDSGFAYFSHTKLNGKYTIRFVIGQSNVKEEHVLETWEKLEEIYNRKVNT
jgi:aromatic-L-amino-acid/L-tryptophan decarboxylase